MSRTYKDKPAKMLYKFYWERNQPDAPKVAREVDSEWHWLQSTPSWWNHLFHTKPHRAEGRNWQKVVEKSKVEDLEDIDTPNVSNKPHKYYW